jgi:hypothetical protein
MQLRPDPRGVSLYGTVDLEVEVTGDEAAVAAAATIAVAAAAAVSAPPATTTTTTSRVPSGTNGGGRALAAASKGAPLKRTDSGRSTGSVGSGSSSTAGRKQAAASATTSKAVVNKGAAEAPTVATTDKVPPQPQPLSRRQPAVPSVNDTADVVPGRTVPVGVWVPAPCDDGDIDAVAVDSCGTGSHSAAVAEASVAASDEAPTAPPLAPSGVVPFSGVGVALGSGSDEGDGAAVADGVRCSHCSSVVPAANAAIHSARCGRAAASAATQRPTPVA